MHVQQGRWLMACKRGGAHRSAVEAKPSSAAEMEPTVTAICNQCKKVRSFAKNVFGSMRIGVARSRGLCAPMMRSKKFASGGPPVCGAEPAPRTW